MSKNMVERVAEAMEEAAGSWAEGRLEIPEECPYPILARAAIEAMRSPTEEMVEAAAETPGMSAVNAVMGIHQARGYGFKAGSFDAGSPLHQAWRAMITAALKP